MKSKITVLERLTIALFLEQRAQVKGIWNHLNNQKIRDKLVFLKLNTQSNF